MFLNRYKKSPVLIISSTISRLPKPFAKQFFSSTGYSRIRDTQNRDASSPQLQESSGTDLVFDKLKPADWYIAKLLMHKVKDFSPYESYRNPLHVTDLGGGDGQMLNYLLTLSTRMVLHVNEPSENLRSQYLKRIVSPYHADRLDLGFISKAGVKMEEIAERDALPKADVIMACHSLYYNTRLWNNPNIELKDHLFTKFLSWLKEKGIICVILQSTEPTQIEGANGKMLPNLDTLENLVYPLIEKSQQNYATAEMLEKALGKFSQKLFAETGRKIVIHSSLPAICCIDLGDVKFQPNPDNNGKYDQSDERTRKLFDFYTRNEYTKLSAEKQKLFLNFIDNNCKTVNGRYVVTHVNKAIAVQEVTNSFQDKLQTDTNKLSFVSKL